MTTSRVLQRLGIRRTRVLGLLAAIVLSSSSSLAAAGASPLEVPVTVTNQAQLTALLNQGASLNSLPSVLVPPASLGKEFPGTQGCLVSPTSTNAIAARPATSVCTWGDPTASHTVVLFGDSQAAMWLPAMSALGTAEHVKVVLYAMSACNLASTPLWNLYSLAASQACTAFRSWALTQIAALKPIAVVTAFYALPNYTDYNHRPVSTSKFSAALKKTYQALVATGAKVVAFGNIPLPPLDPALCLSAHPNQIHGCGVGIHQAVNAPSVAVVSAAARGSRASFVSPINWACSKSFCPIEANHTILYFDQFHLAKHYVLEIAPVVIAALVKLGVA